MRFAFISDIHGNLYSLELVLSDIQQANVDQIVCLGDVASLGPQPREVIARLRELQIPIIMGNHDNYLLNLHLTENQLPWLRASEAWCQSQLKKDDLEFLSSFQPHLSFDLDQNTKMLCYHGSLRSNEEFLYPNTPSKTLDEIFGVQDAKILIGGHTHVQMVRPHRTMILINPGSVGMPFEYPTSGPDLRAIRRAEYAIVEMTDGNLTFNLHQLPIDFEEMVKPVRASDMPDVDFWLSTWSP